MSALVRAMRSWRTAAVALLSFSSGLPLGLVWYAIPDWMRSIGVDLRVVGLFTLALILLAIGVGAYPVVRRLTKRLERLQQGVEALGTGDLSARVKVEGDLLTARGVDPQFKKLKDVSTGSELEREIVENFDDVGLYVKAVKETKWPEDQTPRLEKILEDFAKWK